MSPTRQGGKGVITSTADDGKFTVMAIWFQIKKPKLNHEFVRIVIDKL
jgi:hypothetical protein